MQNKGIKCENNIYTWEYNPTDKKEDAYNDIIPLIQQITENYVDKTEEEQNIILDKVVDEIRKINYFPIFYFNNEGIKEEILTVYNKDNISFVDNGVYTQLKNGLLLLDYLFPNLHLATTCNEKTSIIDRFYNDETLKKCIHIYLTTGNSKIFNMRTVFFSSARFYWDTPINFSPMRAKTIYEHFCPTNGVIYDYSAGYGGRMLGALCSKRNFTYIAVEPNINTFYNLKTLGKYIKQTLNKKDNCYKIFNLCSENFKLKNESVDFIFSCPPFFKKENYSDEITQSANNYPNLQEWLEKYVRPTIRHSFNGLKEKGVYGVDIMNYYFSGKKVPLIENWIRIAEEEGFYFKGSVQIASRFRKANPEECEKIYLFMKKEEYSLPDYTEEETFREAEKDRIKKEKEKYRKEHRMIGEYDIFGNLVAIHDYYNNDLTNINIKSKKLQNNKYYIVYYGDDTIEQQIKVKKPVCKINNIYYYSYSMAGSALGVSRQAVQQSHKRLSKKIKNIDIEWY